jgi:hypothetical protein
MRKNSRVETVSPRRNRDMIEKRGLGIERPARKRERPTCSAR